MTRAGVPDMPVGGPSQERLEQGPIVVFECSEEIPCNPCEGACAKKAIVVGERISAMPTLLEHLCNGCGECIAACPGLAMFVVDYTYSETHGTVALPYEFLPCPEKGETVYCRDRAGAIRCEGLVVDVVSRPRYDKTVVVTVAIPKDLVAEVRAISLRRR